MKIAILSVAFAIISVASMAQSQSSELKGTLESLYKLMANESNGAVKLESSDPDGCEVKIVDHFSADPVSGRKEFTSSLSFSFADIDPGAMEVMPDADWAGRRLDNGKSRVWYHATNYAYVVRDYNSLFPDSHYPRSGFFFVVDDAIAPKVATDLKQAAQLCGGKLTHLSPERIYEFDLSTMNMAPTDIGDYRLVPVNNRYPYYVCKEISHDAKLEGGSFFKRDVVDGALIYHVGAFGDKIFGKTSTASVHVKILETLDRDSSKCGKTIDTFPLKEELGPSFGWTSQRGYIEGNRTLLLEVSAPEPGETYCTHKVVVYTVEGGDRSINISKWDKKSMTLVFSEQYKGLPGGSGIHLGVILYVRYLRGTDRSLCTAPPPAGFNDRHQRLRQVKQPDGSLFFEYDPNNNPSGTPH